MSNFKKTILKYFPVHFFKSYRSYSQEGEDMVLKSFFEARKNYKGFFVDVGAHHPIRFSNTAYFYKHGWNGINIEPTPGAVRIFKFLRRRDINLNIGVSNKIGKLNFYCFNEPALNGFSKEISETRDKTSARYYITKEIEIETYPLSYIFDKYLPEGKKIDFISIDVEGLDLMVLQSNNWEKYNPEYILVEDAINMKRLQESEVFSYLETKGYDLVSKTLRTLFFKKN